MIDNNIYSLPLPSSHWNFYQHPPIENPNKIHPLPSPLLPLQLFTNILQLKMSTNSIHPLLSSHWNSLPASLNWKCKETKRESTNADFEKKKLCPLVFTIILQLEMPKKHLLSPSPPQKQNKTKQNKTNVKVP